MSKKIRKPQAPKIRNFIAKDMLDPVSNFHGKTFRDRLKDSESYRKAKHKTRFMEESDDRYN